MSGPPKRIKLADAVRYVKEQHGIEVTRQTIYNWRKSGKQGRKLPCVTAAGNIYTTEEALDDFVANTPR